GRAYAVEVEGIQGVSTETEAAVADIRRVADLIVARGIPTLFLESTINPRTVEAVREAVAARGGSVALGESLYADALGDAGAPEGTYVGMRVHNVTAIAARPRRGGGRWPRGAAAGRWGRASTPTRWATRARPRARTSACWSTTSRPSWRASAARRRPCRRSSRRGRPGGDRRGRRHRGPERRLRRRPRAA